LKSKQPQGCAVLAIVMREIHRVVDGFGDQQGSMCYSVHGAVWRVDQAIRAALDPDSIGGIQTRRDACA
jgi:hypothetical protein